MILTDEEIWQIGMQDISLDAPYGYARAIESAVLAKLKAQEPVAWLHKFEKQNGDQETDASVSYAVAKAFCDFGDPVPLYTHPLPPDDVVRDPRVAELEAVLRECREALVVCKERMVCEPYAVTLKAIAKIDEVLNG